MKVVVMGCGRAGGRLSAMLDEEGHEVIVMDLDPAAFRWLPPSFKGKTIVGDGTDEDALRKAEAETAEAFVATTQGDNRNVLAAQKAKYLFRIPKIVCRIYDPIRREMYRDLGLETISPTTVTAELLKNALER
ncbi:MAG: potassium channel family protein [Dehalococcoidia bacterium]